ncbi:hypothetical protein TgHK011_008565 [Trichoderma gracile]|nr:hypothetical protein TgHK011_008565 [Trichoderma gracile]
MESTMDMVTKAENASHQGRHAIPSHASSIGSWQIWALPDLPPPYLMCEPIEAASSPGSDRITLFNGLLGWATNSAAIGPSVLCLEPPYEDAKTAAMGGVKLEGLGARATMNLERNIL